MFKNVIPFSIKSPWAPSKADVLDNLAKHEFRPCGPLDRQTTGFTAAHADGDNILSLGDQWLLRIRTESKVLPGKAVKKAIGLRIAKIMLEEDRKVGRKEKEEIKQSVIDEMLPRALSVEGDDLLWIDLKNQILYAGAGSRKRAEEIVALFVGSIDSPPEISSGFDLEHSPAEAMREWLISSDAPADFTIDDRCELVLTEEKSAVKYVHHSLEGDEIINHLSCGKIPKSLAMTWNDRVSFVMTDDLGFKSIKLLELATKDFEPGEDAAAHFEAEFILASSEIGKAVVAMIEAIGIEE